MIARAGASATTGTPPNAGITDGKSSAASRQQHQDASNSEAVINSEPSSS